MRTGRAARRSDRPAPSVTVRGKPAAAGRGGPGGGGLGERPHAAATTAVAVSAQDAARRTAAASPRASRPAERFGDAAELEDQQDQADPRAGGQQHHAVAQQQLLGDSPWASCTLKMKRNIA